MKLISSGQERCPLTPSPALCGGGWGGGTPRGLPTCSQKPLATANVAFPHPNPPPQRAGEGARHRKRRYDSNFKIAELADTRQRFVDTGSRSRGRKRPSFALDRPPSPIRGRGECRVPNAPAAWCALGVVKYAHQYSQRRHRKHPAFPTQWFYDLYALSSGTGLFCPRHLRDA